MTDTYKKIYNYKDEEPPTVSIGCEIATRQMEEYEYGYLVPIKTKIVFLKVDRDIVFTKKGGADYNHIAALLQQQGYPKALWCIHSIWITQDDTNIF